MGFFCLGLLFWSLIGASMLLFVYGVLKKSWKALFISGMIFLPPSLILGGVEGWMRMVVVLPWVAFILAYSIKKKSATFVF